VENSDSALRWGWASAMFSGEEGTFLVDRTLIAFRIGAFAGRLAVMFQEQIGARSGIEGRWRLRLNCILGLAVVDGVVFALSA